MPLNSPPFKERYGKNKTQAPDYDDQTRSPNLHPQPMWTGY
ncbi:hypothetical protein RSSM_00216 [Rhodopirellula sallentina SM41]|uniref:Uncharacterized protein n=1 Tax=Rhodopirellula sallentina SM41 TaxID=1263870 RepID=M5UKG6_9BACT|nr:hypothetical protein RSSM_00216 [Rhodopirellula sallentina SM41]